MATTAVFDLSLTESLDHLADSLDDLEDVSYTRRDDKAEGELVISLAQPPLMLYLVAAAVLAIPLGLAWAFDNQNWAFGVLLSLPAAIAILQVRRPTPQGSIVVRPAPGDEDATKIRINSKGMERFIFMRLREVTDRFDREAIAMREDPDAQPLTMMELFEMGPRPRGGGSRPEPSPPPESPSPFSGPQD